MEWLLKVQTTPYTRESGVWLAVLWRAILDATSKRPSRYQVDALNWFNINESHVGSFNWICGVLELNPVEFIDELTDNFEKIAQLTRSGKFDAE